MKILFFFTSYRQFDEFEFQFKIIEKYTRFTPDILIYNNNYDIDIQTVSKFLGTDSKLNISYFNDEENTGYVSGLFTGLNKCFKYFLNYDYVFHLHPDVFLIDENKIFDLILKNHSLDIEFYVSKISENFCFTDFFIFRPNQNYFLNFIDYIDSNQAETILSNICKSTKNVFFDRFKDNTEFEINQRKLDNFDIIHTHDIESLKSNIPHI